MHAILGVAFFIFAIFAGSANAKNGCRQCTGVHTLSFKTQASLGQVMPFIELALEDCATGNQWDLASINKLEDCDLKLERKLCRVWHISTSVWRYCGNGPDATRSRPAACINDVCSVENFVKLGCYQSVNCASKCEPKDCK